jgi:hypothetical protein
MILGELAGNGSLNCFLDPEIIMAACLVPRQFPKCFEFNYT